MRSWAACCPCSSVVWFVPISVGLLRLRPFSTRWNFARGTEFACELSGTQAEKDNEKSRSARKIPGGGKQA